VGWVMVEARTRVSDKMRGMVAEVETEVARLIAYVNDEVVPEVRRGSSRGLRAAAEQLGQMAEQLDRGDDSRAGTHAVRHSAAGRASAGR
jgi:hypothetical protein